MKNRKGIQFKHWLIMPSTLIMLAVMIFPLIYSLRTSLFYYIMSKPFYRPFIWFENYKNIITDTRVLKSIVVTLKISFIALAIELILGFFLAYCLTKINRLKNFFLSILTIPMMLSAVAIGLMWRLLLNPDLGIINYLFRLVGISPKPWLALPGTALGAIIFVEVWRSTPFVILMFYSGMLSLPIEPYEAAMIDGANGWQKLYYLTIPLLRPIIMIILTLRLIDLIKMYDLVFIMTHGGPGSSTETITHYIYKLAFMNLDLGQASAASWLIVIIVSVFSTVLFNSFVKKS
jgi:multiple sugar transport system permease protein